MITLDGNSLGMIVILALLGGVALRQQIVQILKFLGILGIVGTVLYMLSEILDGISFT